MSSKTNIIKAATIRFSLATALALSTPNVYSQSIQGSFDNPVDGSTESGVSVISGWHCTAKEIGIEIDGNSMGKAGSGTRVLGTTPVCGHPETGFSMLYNWNNLTPGQHVIKAYADGVLLGTKTINTVQSAAQQFAKGLSKSYTLSDFPSSNQMATIEWREAKQSFVITQVRPATFTTEWLNGKTFYTVFWEYGMARVERITFGSSMATFHPILNSDNSGTANYSVDSNGRLDWLVGGGKYSQMACGGNAQYFRVHWFNGEYMSAELWFYNETDALSYASLMTGDEQLCYVSH